MKRLQDLCRLHAPAPPATRRGSSRQRLWRQLGRSVRQGAVDYCRQAKAQGQRREQAAARLGLAPRTLRGWERRQQQDLQRLPGRPLRRAGVAARNEVIDFLEVHGPGLGVPTLRACFPGLARAELADLVRRYRRVWRRRQRPLQQLHWRCPGSVWAIDYTEPPRPIDGIYPFLLAVRDLASSQQLLWLPVPDTTAGTATAALNMLFIQHGAPLVLKSDNGSAFCAGAVATLLHRWEVQPLFSPPHWPRYNGACEAGIGSMKTRTYHQAARQGHPGSWSTDDVEAAVRQANETARPWGELGPSPEQVWNRRLLITIHQRQDFQRTLAWLHHERCQQDFADDPLDLRGNASDSGLGSHSAAVQRNIIRRALVVHGFLEVRRRAFPILLTLTKTA